MASYTNKHIRDAARHLDSEVERFLDLRDLEIHESYEFWRYHDMAMNIASAVDSLTGIPFCSYNSKNFSQWLDRQVKCTSQS